MSDVAARIYRRLLILRCQAGDEAALRELIGEHSPGLRLYLAKIGGASALADDWLQETWIDVYRKINRLENPDAFVSWLYRIARDKAYGELRRRHLLHVSADDQAVEDVAEPETSFSPEEAREIRAALDELPLEQREVLVLRFIESMSYEQIAHIIARPLGTVRSRIHYAKLALRARLESIADQKELHT